MTQNPFMKLQHWIGIEQIWYKEKFWIRFRLYYGYRHTLYDTGHLQWCALVGESM